MSEFFFIRQLTRTLLYPSLCWYNANDEYREQRIYTDHLNGQLTTFWLSGQHFQFSEGHLRGDIKIVLQIENGDFTALQYTVSLENVLDISIEPYKTLLSFSTSTKLTSKAQFRKPVKCGLSIATTFFALLVCHVL